MTNNYGAGTFGNDLSRVSPWNWQQGSGVYFHSQKDTQAITDLGWYLDDSRDWKTKWDFQSTDSNMSGYYNSNAQFWGLSDNYLGWDGERDRYSVKDPRTVDRPGLMTGKTMVGSRDYRWGSASHLRSTGGVSVERIDWDAYDRDPQYQLWLASAGKQRFNTIEDILDAEAWMAGTVREGLVGVTQDEWASIQSELEQYRIQERTTSQPELLDVSSAGPAVGGWQEGLNTLGSQMSADFQAQLDQISQQNDANISDIIRGVGNEFNNSSLGSSLNELVDSIGELGKTTWTAIRQRETEDALWYFADKLDKLDFSGALAGIQDGVADQITGLQTGYNQQLTGLVSLVKDYQEKLLDTQVQLAKQQQQLSDQQRQISAGEDDQVVSAIEELQKTIQLQTQTDRENQIALAQAQDRDRLALQEAWNTNFKQLEDSKQSEIDNLESTFEQFKEDSSTQISELEKQLSDQQDTANEVISSLEKEIEDQQTATDTTINSLKDQISELDDTQVDQKQALENQITDIEESNKQTIQELEKQIADENEASSKTISELSDQLEQQKKDSATALEEQEKQLTQKIADVEAASEEDIKELTLDFDKQFAEFEESSQADIEDLEQQIKAGEEARQADLAEWEKTRKEEKKSWEQAWELKLAQELQEAQKVWSTDEERRLASARAAWGKDSEAERDAWERARTEDLTQFTAQIATAKQEGEEQVAAIEQRMAELDETQVSEKRALEKQVADIREEMERSVSDMRTQYSQAQEDWKKQAELERRDLEASLHERYQEQWATQKSEIDEGWANLLEQTKSEAEATRIAQVRQFEQERLDEEARWNKELQTRAEQDRVYQSQITQLESELGLQSALDKERSASFDRQIAGFEKQVSGIHTGYQNMFDQISAQQQQASADQAQASADQAAAFQQAAQEQVSDYREISADQTAALTSAFSEAQAEAQSNWAKQFLQMQEADAASDAQVQQQIASLQQTTLQQNTENQKLYQEALKRSQELQIQDAERARVASSYGSPGAILNPKVKGVRLATGLGKSRPGSYRGTIGAFHRQGMRIKSLNI